MFNFFSMADNYESRKVGRDDFDWGFVSTAEVIDGAHPYETAVKHGAYNNGNMVTVAAYDSKEDAKAGHSEWVTKMTSPELPDELVDVCNAEIAQLGESIGMNTTHKKS